MAKSRWGETIEQNMAGFLQQIQRLGREGERGAYTYCKNTKERREMC